MKANAFKLVILAILISGCAYAPSHDFLIKNGFSLHRPVEGTTLFDSYTLLNKDNIFTKITYTPNLHEWVIYAGINGFGMSYVKVSIDSKKEFNLLLQGFKHKH